MRVSAFAASYVRRRTTQRMIDTCRIWKPGPVITDPLTKRATRSIATLKYEGPCRFWEVSAGSQVTVGEEQVTMTQSFLSVPYNTAVPESDDIIQILSSDDTDLVNRTVHIISMVRGGGLRASRRFLVSVTDSKRGSW